jgi:beta-glucosidase
MRLHRDYRGPTLYVMENGAAFKDTLADGRVRDEERTRYLAEHIRAVADAIRQGAQVGGYMVWSLMDNFEWASGYEKRFGIVHVDYATQARLLKDSALWYREFLMGQRARRG